MVEHLGLLLVSHTFWPLQDAAGHSVTPTKFTAKPFQQDKVPCSTDLSFHWIQPLAFQSNSNFNGQHMASFINRDGIQHPVLVFQ